MTALAEMTTRELARLITDAATELQRRATSSPRGARSSGEVLTAESPVLPRRCNYCSAPIVLACTERNGEWIPLDESEGNFMLVNGRARGVNGGGTHAFHYDNCPGSAQNQPEEPVKSLFDDLTEELGLGDSLSSGLATDGGDA